MAHELSFEILRQIRQAGTLNRSEIAKSLDISLSLVSKLISELLALNLIKERNACESVSGRPALRLGINHASGYVIGIDVGGDPQIAVMVNLAGEIVSSVENPAPDYEFTTDHLEYMVGQIIQKSGILPSEVLGLGVGVYKIVDPVLGRIYRTGDSQKIQIPNTTYDLPFRQVLADRLPFAHILVDDIVRTLGIAEVGYGLGCGEKNFIYLLADSGLGMAIMLNGIPFIGASHIAGEIAHIPISNRSVLCSCGNWGCLNTLASIPGVLRLVKQRLVDSPVHSHLRALNEIDIWDIIEAGEQGDKVASQALIEAGEYMGEALAVIVNLLGPSLVIMGGKLAHSNVYRETAGRQMRLYALEMAERGVELKLTSLDELAGARGAATLVINSLFEPGEKDLLHLKKGCLSTAFIHKE